MKYQALLFSRFIIIATSFFDTFVSTMSYILYAGKCIKDIYSII